MFARPHGTLIDRKQAVFSGSRDVHTNGGGDAESQAIHSQGCQARGGRGGRGVGRTDRLRARGGCRRQAAQDPPVGPLRARLRQVVRPVGEGLGRQARGRGVGGPRGVRGRGAPRHRRGGRAVRPRRPHVHRARQRLRGARDRPQGGLGHPREEVRQAGRAGDPQHLQPVHQEAVRAVRHVGAGSGQLPQEDLVRHRDAERAGDLRRPGEGRARDQEGRAADADPHRHRPFAGHRLQHGGPQHALVPRRLDPGQGRQRGAELARDAPGASSTPSGSTRSA